MPRSRLRQTLLIGFMLLAAPLATAPLPAGTGRSPMPLAGGGVPGGQVIGATDEIGWSATEEKVHVHDLHATILHQFGLDHERLTYRFQGRDFRITDVHGNVVDKLTG